MGFDRVVDAAGTANPAADSAYNCVKRAIQM
jgi:hypothetical protein